MSMTFTARSPDELREKIERFSEIFPEAVKIALFERASVIMNQSKEQVPVDTGWLRETGYVADPWDEGGKITVELGYYATYAAPVHDIDIPHYVGKWHFLSDPMEYLGPGLQQEIVNRISEMLGGE